MHDGPSDHGDNPDDMRAAVLFLIASVNDLCQALRDDLRELRLFNPDPSSRESFRAYVLDRAVANAQEKVKRAVDLLVKDGGSNQ